MLLSADARWLSHPSGSLARRAHSTRGALAGGTRVRGGRRYLPVLQVRLGLVAPAIGAVKSSWPLTQRAGTRRHKATGTAHAEPLLRSDHAVTPGRTPLVVDWGTTPPAVSPRQGRALLRGTRKQWRSSQVSTPNRER